MYRPELSDLELLVEKVLRLKKVFSEDEGHQDTYLIGSHNGEEKEYVFLWRADRFSGGYWQVFAPYEYG